FNGRVVIPYEVSEQGSVTLRVYNASGQRVRDLFRGYRDVGRYRATWDGRDDAGKEIASGVYVWELRGGGQMVRRMVTLIR
ncbi:MAG TPA: T9SS type A sorting domain-containing protein, partial [Candidatus Latescibacteria bacterium]|nr:T9SS type A sorting domain-containing protein [Candidatus Latescibacterota bacterium]